jgi:hypothetical protein
MSTLTAVSGPSRIRFLRGPQGALIVAGVLIVIGFTLAHATFSEVLIAPILATEFFVLACVVALIGCSSRTGAGLSYWDVAGLLTFAGICVTQAVEPESVIQIINDLNSPNRRS